MAQRALTPSNAAYCSECGAETKLDAAQCSRCDQPFEGTIQAVFCPICNSINPAEATECRNCKAKFPEPGSIGTAAPLAPGGGTPEEEYLRRILQLSREKAKVRDAEPPSNADLPEGSEPASFLESGGREGEMEESLWKLAEPFDRMLVRRKRRLEQMDSLIDRARGRIKGLEASQNPLEIRERDELKRQIEELLLEKEDILRLEEGLATMEKTYRNILRLQQDELKARETSLRSRIDAFRRELESREKAFGQLEESMERLVEEKNKLVEQQKDLLALKDELKVVMKDVDELLGDLPADKIEGFAKSKKFALYEKILDSLEL